MTNLSSCIHDRFSLIQMTLRLCWSSPARYRPRCQETLLSNLLSWASYLGGDGLLDAPTSGRGHSRRQLMRLLRWRHPRLRLELVVARLFCLKKQRMGREWSKTSLHHDRMVTRLRVKLTGWPAHLPAQSHPVRPTSPPYLPLQTPPLHLPLRPLTT